MNRLYPLFFVPLSVGCGVSGSNWPVGSAEVDPTFGPYCYPHPSMQVAFDEVAPNGFAPMDAIAAAQGLVVDFDLAPLERAEVVLTRFTGSMTMQFSPPLWADYREPDKSAYYFSGEVDQPTPDAYARNAQCEPGLYVPASWTSTSSDGLSVSVPAIGGLFVSPEGTVRLLQGMADVIDPSPVIDDVAHASQAASRGPWETQEVSLAMGARVAYPELEEPSTTLDGRFIVSVWAYLIGDAPAEADDVHHFTRVLHGEAVVE